LYFDLLHAAKFHDGWLRVVSSWLFVTDCFGPGESTCVYTACTQPDSSPAWLLRLRIVELTLDHEAPYFSNMRRRNSRKDSDLTGVVDLRYTGGARLLLMLELGMLQHCQVPLFHMHAQIKAAGGPGFSAGASPGCAHVCVHCRNASMCRYVWSLC
jgi:hypothetical protein